MIFILGIERSATTWVSNILDHHPKTDTYMEPLSVFNTKFNQWPNRFVHLEDLEIKEAYFKRQFKLMAKNKRFLLTRFSDSAYAWRLDLYLVEYLLRKHLAKNELKDFFEQNFHRKEQRISVAKQPPLETVIKELRLNFNAELIRKLDEQGKVLVVIREMASCVRSILQQIEEGNLVELRRILIKQYGKISIQTVAKYWTESYSSLIETLRDLSISHKIISHTELMKNTDIVIDDMFHFLNLTVTNDVRKYIEISNRPGNGKHSTQRSSEEVLEQMQKDQAQIYPHLKQELKIARHHAVLKKFVNAS